MDYNYLHFLREALVCYLDEFQEDHTIEEGKEERDQVNTWLHQMMVPKLRENDRFYLSELLKSKILKGVTDRINKQTFGEVNHEKLIKEINSPDKSPEISRLKVESGVKCDKKGATGPIMTINDERFSKGLTGVTGGTFVIE